MAAAAEVMHLAIAEQWLRTFVGQNRDEQANRANAVLLDRQTPWTPVLGLSTP